MAYTPPPLPLADFLLLTCIDIFGCIADVDLTHVLPIAYLAMKLGSGKN